MTRIGIAVLTFLLIGGGTAYISDHNSNASHNYSYCEAR